MRLLLVNLLLFAAAVPTAWAAPWLRPAEIAARLRDLARSDGTGRVRVVELGRSRLGRPILALVVGRSRSRALFVGLHHGREWLAADTVLRLAEHLARGGCPRAARLAGTREAWLIPVLNPDGYALSFEPGRRGWRKNARDNDGDGALGPADGVDLNRNYDFRWKTAPRARPDPMSPEYRGPAPFSEPETRAVRDLLASRAFAFAISYHAFGSYLVYPAAADPVAREPVDAPIFRALAGTTERPAIRSSLRLDRDDGTERYRVEVGNPDIGGRFGAWAYHRAGVPAFYVELADGYGFVFPGDERLRARVFRDNLPFALDVLESAGTPARPVSHLGHTAAPLAHRPAGRSRGRSVLIQVVARKDLGAVTLFHQGPRGVGWHPMAPLERGVHYARFGARVRHPGGALRYYFRAGKLRLPARGSFRLEHDGPGGGRLVVTAQPRRWRRWLGAAGVDARLWSHDAVPDAGTVLGSFETVIWDAVGRKRRRNAEGLRELARFVSEGGRAVIIGGPQMGRGRPPRPRRLRLAAGLPGKPRRRQVDVSYIAGGVEARDYVRRAVRTLAGAWLDGRTRRPLGRLHAATATYRLARRQRPLQLRGPAVRALVTGPPQPPWECKRRCWQSGAADHTLARLSLRLDLRDIERPRLSVRARWDLERSNDYFFVEARRPGGRWTTLADIGGATGRTFGPRRERDPGWRRAWVRTHAPDLLRYLTPASGAGAWKPLGRSGAWHAVTGRGRSTLRFDLTPFVGGHVELAFAYLADPYKHGRGVVLGEVRLGRRRLLDGSLLPPPSAAFGDGRWAVATSPAFSPTVAVRRGRVTVTTVHPGDVLDADRAAYLRALLGDPASGAGIQGAPRDAGAERR